MAEVLSTVRCVMRGVLNGIVCENAINWYSDAYHPTTTSQNIALAVEDQIWDALQPLICVHFTLYTITAWYADFNGVQTPQYELTVNQNGGVAGGQYLPPRVVVNIMKIPDNSETTPPNQPDFKLGRHGFSGIMEDNVDFGRLNQAAIDQWNAFGEVMETLTVTDGSSDIDYTLGTFRPSSVNGTEAYVYTLETYVSPNLGTRNSRT